MPGSPLSDFDASHEVGAIPELVQSAFVKTYWTPQRTEDFLNQTLITNEKAMKSKKGRRSISLNV